MYDDIGLEYRGVGAIFFILILINLDKGGFGRGTNQEEDHKQIYGKEKKEGKESDWVEPAQQRQGWEHIIWFFHKRT